MLKDDKDIEENKVVAAIGYIHILFLVPLFLKRGSKFAQFHGKQGLVLFIGYVIATFIWFLWIPLVMFSIFGFIQAITGKYYRLPLIADISEKFNI